MLDKVFKLSANGTNIRTEVVAGITSFMAMAYIIALNPNILTGFNSHGQGLWNAIFVATCLSSAIAMFCMAFLANKPFCLAPGMGLNNFFAIITANMAALTGLTYLEAYQTMLCLILFDGILFLLLTIFNIREKIITAIPPQIRLGIAPAIGFLLIEIGFGANSAIYTSDGQQFQVLRDFFGAFSMNSLKESMGGNFAHMALTVVTIFLGLISMAVMSKRKFKGAILAGMLFSSIFYWVIDFLLTGANPFVALATASFVPPITDFLDNTFFQLNFSNLFNLSLITIVTLVITFVILDMFDTIGTFIGLASQTGHLDEKGQMPGMKKALMSDAIGTIAGALTGTSTVTTLIESASGVEAGGRTGLTAVVTACIFLACLFLAPFAAIIPPAATSAALIFVGALMMTSLKAINFNDLELCLPVILMLIAMPISGSITHAIGIGIITSVVMGICLGNLKKYSVFSYILALIFLIKFML